MKKYAMLALAAMMTISMVVVAQNQAPAQGWKGEKRDFNKGEKHMMTPEQRADKMAKALNLTDSQKAGVVSYFEKQDAMRKQQREEIQKIRTEMKAKFETQRKSNDEQLAKAIGTENFRKFELKRAERMGEMKGMMKERMKDRRGMNGNHPHENNNGNHPTDNNGETK